MEYVLQWRYNLQQAEVLAFRISASEAFKVSEDPPIENLLY